jgi:hypothetical protein
MYQYIATLDIVTLDIAAVMVMAELMKWWPTATQAIEAPMHLASLTPFMMDI